MDFESCYNKFPIILMEGAVGERLKREYQIPNDEVVALASHIYNEESKKALEEIFNQYISISMKHNFPIMLTTPTRRANKERVFQSKYNKNIICDNVSFLHKLKNKFPSHVYIGGLMGCRGDAYKADSILSVKEALEFHSWQASLFAETKVDFLYAGIMPALSEAIGMAMTMENTSLPYIISFMIKENGQLIDGTTIHEAIAAIDSSTKRKPLCYMTNCVHPTVVFKALSQIDNTTTLVQERFKGIQANTSSLPPELLDISSELKTSDANSFAAGMLELYKNYKLKIFGGCCGTDNTHMNETAQRLGVVNYE
ncbi:homocysteine/selenocysteine methylase (S-methylmethionine-dependent) [Desulfosporosinus orientis DSM 765]|uniref:Homocysteine/selenocysteine methylase (S-methylmethionine-dependent) n=1 Tax=Desulfosporosinus orientis (strain ATCC 19365 / DSM 765 / NCIMB 8382 / VKM B-1628 / Singapore I) TaxID=768706 RepID=G7WAX8_DESOD|nr:homocysteine S-methyltransferase family protein [Desulfosporosinus orientis]AET67479.1 homocysteine/selenocysteine methylase (S-methylmethionine-dependent) [Desulfosporosinus orientis DSM 765]